MSSIFGVMSKIKRSQHILLYSIIGVLSLLVFTLAIAVMNGKTQEKPKAKSYKAPITSGASRLDPKEVWAEKFSNDNELQNKRLENLEKTLETLIKVNQGLALQQAKSQLPSAQPNNLNRQNPENQLAEVRQEISDQVNGPDFIKLGGITNQSATPNPSINSDVNLNNQDAKSFKQSPGESSLKKEMVKRFRSNGIQKTSINLLNSKSNKPLKTGDNTIPAGAFAGAVMVGGVDASTSIQASNDPRPVLLRITNPGTLPRKFKSDLCGCHVLAACYGDISSERVYMRLEKLTCTERNTGEILEMNVQGYVAGEDGRAGLRGIVVDRAGPSIRNAAVGGFLSGMGNFLSQSHNPVTFSPSNGLAQTNPMTDPQMLRYGAAKGASTALEKYADFYIKRAEQMQPVIQVQAGRAVDIVFTQGIAMEDSAARGALVKVNDQQRLSQINQTHESSQKSVEAWVPNNERG